MFDAELDSFKSRIDLRAYAASQGYQLDNKESWKGSDVMRNSGGDKIVIKQDADTGHYLYFSVRDDRDNGTIIDFVQHRQKISLGTVRMELRPWLGEPPVSVPVFRPLVRTKKDRLHVEAEYAKMQDAPRHPYLEQERAIPSSLLASERFEGRIKIDARGNAIFPHFDAAGLSGYEIKNKGFTGFASGGTKGLWLSNERAGDNRIVFCEAAIDALSHAVLFPDDKARYASIGGKPNPLQPELVLAAINRMPADSKVISAMDADEDGRKLAGIIRQVFDASGRKDFQYEQQEPVGFKDWNDELRGRQRDLFPAARLTGLVVR